MARPRKTRIEKRSARVVLQFTPGEKKRLEAVAERAGLPVATAARVFAMQVVESKEGV